MHTKGRVTGQDHLRGPWDWLSITRRVDDVLGEDLVRVLLLGFVVEKLDARLEILCVPEQNIAKIILTVNKFIEMISEGARVVFAEVFKCFLDVVPNIDESVNDLGWRTRSATATLGFRFNL